MCKLEDTIQEKYFADIRFSDERERQVFLSYIRGFSLMILDSSIKKVLEIGGGQSTALLATLGARLGWEIITIDMNPEAITLKLRNQSVSDSVLRCIHYRKGTSLEPKCIRSYYEKPVLTVGNVPFYDAVRASNEFVDTTMDARKAPRVAQALGLQTFTGREILAEISKSHSFAPELLSVFRSAGDEFEFYAEDAEPTVGLLEKIMSNDLIDAVFLDSGEFSSLPEWTIVNERLRKGGYVVLHDIFFPKSFKNWLVCGSIEADPTYEILYVDRSTPQGLMVARKKD